jgi:hypothetical protein
MGMSPAQVQQAVESFPDTRRRLIPAGENGEVNGTSYDDESGMSIEYAGEVESRRVREVEILDPPPVHSLTRLRRTLAGVFPFLAE